jgi:hypothetical protein
MVARTGIGQPDRTLRLLWRHHRPAERAARGPKQSLTVDGVVDAATRLADIDVSVHLRPCESRAARSHD